MFPIDKAKVFEGTQCPECGEESEDGNVPHKKECSLYVPRDAGEALYG